MRAIKFRINAEFGMFRVPDRQRPALTFSFIPKSAVLGVIGAILGIPGYENGKNPPEFITRLRGLKIAVTPNLPRDERGKPSPFAKTIVGFLNYHGYGNYDENSLSGCSLQLREQVLIRPAYTITVIANDDDPEFIALLDSLKLCMSVYRPYLGKNEFIANLEFVGDYEAGDCTDDLISCQSIFPRSEFFRSGRRPTSIPSFVMVDNYPYSLDSNGYHVVKRFEFRLDGEIYSDEADVSIGKFYRLKSKDGTEKVVFAF